MADAETEQQQQQQQPQAPPSSEAPARAFGAGLHAQALEGECALCGSGNEAEPLGWVVSTTLESFIPICSTHYTCFMQQHTPDVIMTIVLFIATTCVGVHSCCVEASSPLNQYLTNLRSLQLEAEA